MLKSAPDRYGSVAIAVHWLTAILIVGLMLAGFRAANTADPAAKAAILRLHAPIGVAVLALTLLRIGWWWLADRKPPEIAGMPRWQALAAKAVHLMFYVAIVGLAGSGMAMLALSGAGEVLFGKGGVLPDFWNFPPRYGHRALALLMLLLLAAHIGAALWHQFVRKDGLMGRMWFSRGRP